MPNRRLSPLERIDVSAYRLSSSEQIAAGILKHYFITEPLASRQALKHIVKSRTFILNLRDTGSFPILINTDIDGTELKELIDAARGNATMAIAQQAKNTEAPVLSFGAWLMSELIDGRKAISSVSIEFLDFLTDCCVAVFG